MVLRPFVDIDPEETVVSWATRLAATHCNEALAPFLNDISVPFDGLLKGSQRVLERLAEVTAADPLRLAHNSFRLVRRGAYSFRSEQFDKEFLPARSPDSAPSVWLRTIGGGRLRANGRGGVFG